MLRSESMDVKSRREALGFLGALAATAGAALVQGPEPRISTDHEALTLAYDEGDAPAVLNLMANRVRALEGKPAVESLRVVDPDERALLEAWRRNDWRALCEMSVARIPDAPRVPS